MMDGEEPVLVGIRQGSLRGKAYFRWACGEAGTMQYGGLPAAYESQFKNAFQASDVACDQASGRPGLLTEAKSSAVGTQSEKKRQAAR